MPVALNNTFRVAAPLDEVWRTLLDVERVATCLPGASMEPGGQDGTFRGTMKLKLGPLSMGYAGTVELAEVDEDAHVATMRASAREQGGQGTASATIVNRLTADGDGTVVVAETALDVTGRQAQFGRGIMQDVADRMMGQFAQRLEALILAEDPAPGPRGDVAATDDAVRRNPPTPTGSVTGELEDDAALNLMSLLPTALTQPVVLAGAVLAILGTVGAVSSRRRRRIVIRIEL